MKKFISLLLMLSLVFCFAACGGNETPDENSGNNIVNNVDDNQNADNITSNKEITLEDVENAPVSPESDFHYYDVDGGIEVVYDGDDEIVVIPETIGGKKVVAVARRGFVNADAVRAVKLADTIEVVGDSAFNLVDELEIVVAGSNLKRVEDYAFANCPKLKEIKFNEGLEYLGACSIAANPCLGELYIPASVNEIGSFILEDDTVIVCEEGSVVEEHCKGWAHNYRLK